MKSIVIGYMTALLLGLSGVLCTAPMAQAQPVEFTLDFERGDLRGWEAQGRAFASQPTLRDNPNARDRGEPSGHHGKWWIGTFENYQGRPDQQPGATQGDAPTGTLISAPFSVPAGSLTFLVGGGAAFETRVELMVVGQSGNREFNQDRVYHASGENRETMREVRWDLTPYVGQQAFIRIVDASSEGWGHINADYFRFVPPPTVMQPIDPQIITPAIVSAQPTRTRVPALIGLTLPQAMNALEKASLLPGNIDTRVPNYREGQIIEQTPDPRTPVLRGSAVDMLLAGPPLVTVPSLIDQPLQVALRQLEVIGLRAGNIDKQTSSTHQPETVIDQDPRPGRRVPIDSAVVLTIAIAPTIVRVSIPNLRGMTPKQAEAELVQAKLALGQVTQRTSQAKENTVIDQKPRPYEQARAGTVVQVVVAVAPPVRVPDLVGVPQDQARALLEPVGLRMGEILTRASSEERDTVLAQRPQARAEVPRGTPVDVVLATPQAVAIVPVVVPDAIGLSIPRARQRFRDADLAPGPIIELPSDLPPGSVLRHQPPPGARVPPGTAITLWVAVPKPVNPRWMGIPLAVLAILGGAFLVRQRIRSTRHTRTLMSDLKVTPHADSGSVHLQSDDPEGLALDIRLRAVSDPGSQTLEAPDDLIDKEDREP